MISPAIKPATNCPLCHSATEALASVADHFFGSPGIWEYRRCTANLCGVAFPSPAPTDAQLAEAYSSYYTHDDPGEKALPGALEAIFAKAVRVRPFWAKAPILGWLGEQIGWELGGLRPQRGTVVDIGCGDGVRLSRLRRAGWTQAIGVEPDPVAVEAAKGNAIDVHHGSAEALPLSDGCADAVIMHHVIEHVRDPLQAFREAARILRPGAELAIVTPNINSLGRDRWQAYWRGFEAPRHLTIFTLGALESLAAATGFDIVVSRSSARSSAWVDDVSARAAGQARAALGFAARVQRADSLFRERTKAEQELGEEIVFVARKR